MRPMNTKRLLRLAYEARRARSAMTVAHVAYASNIHDRRVLRQDLRLREASFRAEDALTAYVCAHPTTFWEDLLEQARDLLFRELEPDMHLEQLACALRQANDDLILEIAHVRRGREILVTTLASQEFEDIRKLGTWSGRCQESFRKATEALIHYVRDAP